MLSRVQRMEDLMILRPFKESLLDIKMPVPLQIEIKRIEECERKTSSLTKWPEDMIIVSPQ
jgi:hypothetical protein